MRFGQLVSEAAEEIGHESEAAGLACVPIVREDVDIGMTPWIPHRDAAAWSDILRNLIRNAVQATQDKLASGASAEACAVTVHLRVTAPRRTTCVEIVDDGVGMDTSEAEAMWQDGRTRHGEGHGQGLTPGKRRFLEDRAALEVRSAAGVGTCVRIEPAHRDILIRPPRLAAMPLFLVPATILLAGLAFAVAGSPRSPMVNVEVLDGRLVRALDAKGAIRWQRDMPEGILPNFRSPIWMPHGGGDTSAPYLIISDHAAGSQHVALATRGSHEPGRVVVFDARGRDVIEVVLPDGRIYELDTCLRPVACSVGDHTPAADLAPTRAAAPLLYLRNGEAEQIDLPIEWGM